MSMVSEGSIRHISITLVELGGSGSRMYGMGIHLDRKYEELMSSSQKQHQ